MTNNDDRAAVDLMRPLRDVDPTDGPPPRYDVSSAMRQADTIRHRRMAVGAFVAVAAVALAVGVPLGLRSHPHGGPTATAASPSASVRPSSSPTPKGQRPTLTSAADLPLANCTVDTLPVPAGVGAYTAWVGGYVDPTGRYLAGSLIKPFTLPLSDYKPGKAVLVDLQTGHVTLIPIADGGASGVNASGTVIGTTGPNYIGWVYRNGHVSPLPKFKGSPIAPSAINANGDIVGHATVGNTDTSVIVRANQPGIVKELLPKGIYVDTITDNGTIAGRYHDKPWIGDGKGDGRTLPTDATDPRGEVYKITGDYAVGWGLNDHGQGLFPMVWNLANGVLTPYPMVPLWQVATDGTVVGDVSDGDNRVGLIGHNGVLQRLPTGAASDLQVVVDDMTADGHTVVGKRRTSATVSGPISEVGLIWHC
ncbi:MAG TPA: hypothetical protein VKB59_12600 [Micromonosporaceae bacterium]|nr:hypothetical protein [Micromonosporaceae bacterium]